MTRSYRGPGSLFRFKAALMALLLLWAGAGLFAAWAPGPESTIATPSTTADTISEPAGRPAEVVESLPGGDGGDESPSSMRTTGQGPTTDEAPTTTLGYTPGTADDPTLPCPGRPHPEHHYACGTYVAPTTVPRNSVVNAGPVGDVGGCCPYNGWAIPEHIVSCETGGTFSWDAYNASSGAAGPYQLMPFHLGGDARNFSHATQHAKAAELWAGGAGASHWAACL